MVERPDSDLQVVPHSARWTEEFLTKLPAIERLGFSYRANNTMVGTENHLFLRRVVGGRRTHHLHVVVDGAAEIEDYRLFRDALRADRTFAEEYERYKLQLASKYAKDECPTSPRNRTGWVPA